MAVFFVDVVHLWIEVINSIDIK